MFHRVGFFVFQSPPDFRIGVWMARTVQKNTRQGKRSMIHRYVGFATAVWLTLHLGCAPAGDGGTGSRTGAAAIVGKIVTSAETARLLNAQARSCPELRVAVNGAPVVSEFGNDCTFVVTGVQPSAALEVRVELVGLGIAGTLELSNVLGGELIEIVVQPTSNSLTVSVERRTTSALSEDLPTIIAANDVSIQLPVGEFVQTLTVSGNNFTLVGVAGGTCNDAIGWTVIDGAVLVSGNNATFTNILFSSLVEVHGDNARFINCCFGSDLVVFGDGPANAPQLTCPAELTVECDGPGNGVAIAAWLAGNTVVSDCDGLTVSNNFALLGDDCGATGHAVVTWTARDDCGGDSCQSSVSIVDLTDPEISGPADLTFDCDESGTQTELVDWLDGVTGEDVCGDVAITFERDDLDFDCNATIRWTATDECGNASTHSAELTIEGDETPPVLARVGAAALVLECGVDAYVELGAIAADTCDAAIVVVVGGDVVDDHAPGVYVATYASRDLCGHSGVQQIRTVTVEDTLAPTVTSRGRELWPPNHNLETLTLADCALVIDACEGALDANVVGTILSVYSDEPEESNGDGNTTGDIEIVDDHTFRLRSERQGGGNGRVYGVLFTVVDSDGNTSEEECSISVPHDESGSSTGNDGASAGYTVPR